MEELLARQPSDPALALARELIGDRRDVERRLAEADEARTAAERELRELEQARAKHGPCPDPAPLLQRLHAFSDIPADAERLRREALAESLERGRLAEEAARLDPSAGDIDALARLALPDAADVETARQTFDALTEEEKRASAEAKAVRARLAAIEDDIAALSRAGAALTREDLDAARAKRAEAHSRLGAALDGEPSPRREAFAALGDAERAVWDKVRRLTRRSYSRFNHFQEAIANGQPNHWRCRAGARYLYICEFGLVHYCSQQRGYPGIPIAQYGRADVQREFLTEKGCAPNCTISCVHQVSYIDHWRAPQTSQVTPGGAHGAGAGADAGLVQLR